VVFYGCDIAKKEFEVDGPDGRLSVNNEPASIRTWIKTTPKDAVIALESTGGYGLALAEIAHKSGRTVFVLAPRQIAAHRRSLGRRAQTDKMDATLIAEFIRANHDQLHPFQPWAEPWKGLRDTVRLRTRLARDRARIAMRMRAFGYSDRQTVKVTKGIKDLMQELDAKIKKQLNNVLESEAVSSPKGIGPLTAAASIAALKQIPFKDKDAFVAYIGLDLIVSDSGTQKGKRAISSWGDVTLRNLYYLAGKTAANTTEWQGYVAKLQRRGMKPIQIHCAIARRLARIVYSLFHTRELYDPLRIVPKPSDSPPMLALQA
jgi:transposase